MMIMMIVTLMMMVMMINVAVDGQSGIRRLDTTGRTVSGGWYRWMGSTTVTTVTATSKGTILYDSSGIVSVQGKIRRLLVLLLGRTTQRRMINVMGSSEGIRTGYFDAF